MSAKLSRTASKNPASCDPAGDRASAFAILRWRRAHMGVTWAANAMAASRIAERIGTLRMVLI
jgi:hypothetical protein